MKQNRKDYFLFASQVALRIYKNYIHVIRKKKKKNTIVATVCVRLAMPVRMSLVPTKVRTIARIEVDEKSSQFTSNDDYSITPKLCLISVRMW